MPEYYELILDGDVDTLRGFLVGYLMASDMADQVFVAKDVHVEHDSLAHEVAEFMGLFHDRSHVIVPGELKDNIEKGLEKSGGKLKIKVHEAHLIAEATFHFQWTTHNREEGEELKGLFANPPANVHLHEYEPEEIVHEDEKGQIGVYAPTQPYTLKAEGSAHGDPGSVIRWAAELRQNEFVELGEIKLTRRD